MDRSFASLHGFCMVLWSIAMVYVSIDSVDSFGASDLVLYLESINHGECGCSSCPCKCKDFASEGRVQGFQAGVPVHFVSSSKTHST